MTKKRTTWLIKHHIDYITLYRWIMRRYCIGVRRLNEKRVHRFIQVGVARICMRETKTKRTQKEPSIIIVCMCTARVFISDILLLLFVCTWYTAPPRERHNIRIKYDKPRAVCLCKANDGHSSRVWPRMTDKISVKNVFAQSEIIRHTRI